MQAALLVIILASMVIFPIPLVWLYLRDYTRAEPASVVPRWQRGLAVGLIVLALGGAVLCLALGVWPAATVMGIFVLWRLVAIVLAARAGWPAPGGA